MNNLKDFANDTVIKDLALECKQYRELIPRLCDDLAAVKKAHKEALEFNYDLAEENTAIHTKAIAMQKRIAEQDVLLSMPIFEAYEKLKAVAEAAVTAWEADQIGRMNPYDENLSNALDELEQPLRAAGYLND
jgi:protocatechuate 3,4-dioxygenase beta subunit